jgi:hypothetical protein
MAPGLWLGWTLVQRDRRTARQRSIARTWRSRESTNGHEVVLGHQCSCLRVGSECPPVRVDDGELCVRSKEGSAPNEDVTTAVE